MDLKTKRTICLVVGIASILTIVSTISYAYFSTVSDMRPVQTVINTATVSATFSDYGVIAGASLNFGESVTKRFTIENTGTAEAKVKMYWVDLINTYTEESLTYTLSYSENEAGPFTEVIEKTNVPQSKNSSKKELANSLSVPVGKTYYYNLVITLNYLNDVNQDADLSAVFNSKFGLEDINYVAPNPVSDIIAANKGVKTGFDSPATTDEGIFEMEDDYGTSYYYRGAVENNYVKFAGFYWRIIRLNGDGSLRIIYDGTSPHANGEESADRLARVGQVYNSKEDDAKYVGWMFGGALGAASTSKAQAQLSETNSDIKTAVDEWYKTNIQDKGYGQYVSDTLFCNDRTTPGKTISQWTSDTGLGYAKNSTSYGAYGRYRINDVVSLTVKNNIQPIFTCSQKNDAFTVSDEEKGNGALTYPVGLITADEIVAAGSGTWLGANKQYYLYRSENYYSLSPCYFKAGSDPNAGVFIVGDDGGLNNISINYTFGAVVPVINLSAEYAKSMSGDGTLESPYAS